MASDQLITVKPEVKYLGVWLDQKLNWKRQIAEISKRAMALKINVCKIFSRTCPVSTAAKKLIYTSVLEPKLTYGAEIWGEALRHKLNCAKVDSAQRGLLIWVAGAYRTTSGRKLREIIEKPRLSSRCKAILKVYEGSTAGKLTVSSLCVQYLNDGKWKLPASVNSQITTSRNLRKKISKSESLFADNESDQVGLPPEWMSLTVLTWSSVCSPHTVQFITGYGGFGTYLTRMKLTTTDQCGLCNSSQESPKHLLTECKGTANLRAQIATLFDNNQVKITPQNKNEFINICKNILIMINKTRPKLNHTTHTDQTNSNVTLNRKRSILYLPKIHEYFKKQKT